MWRLRNLLNVENVYNLLVQLDYLAGLCVAVLLGMGKWSMFTIALVVSLILGLSTVWVYIRMMKKIVGGNNGNTPKNR